MFNIRLSSVLYPTQLHRHDTCARASARARAHTQLYRYYHLILHMLFDGLHTSCVWSSEGGVEDEAFWKSQRTLERLWPRCLGGRLIHSSITAQRISIFIISTWQRKEFADRKSAVFLTDAAFLETAHTLAMCSRLLELVAERTHKHTHTHGLNSSAPHLVLHDITAPCEPEWQAVCLFSSSRRSLFPVLPLF